MLFRYRGLAFVPGDIEALMDISAGLAEKVFKAAFRFLNEGTTITRFRLQSLIPDKF